MDRSRWSGGVNAALGAIVVAALLAPPAHARPWARLAPAPLASDSSYLALSSRPLDSLTVGQYLWMSVQRDWRAQRDAEVRSLRRSLTDVEATLHSPRPGDKRFAALAARPYEALSDSERTWLVAENEAQRANRGPGASGGLGFFVFLSLVGTAAALALIFGLRNIGST